MGKKSSELTAQVDRMSLVMAEVRNDLKSLQEEMTYTLQKFGLPVEEHTKCVHSIGKMRKKLSGAMTRQTMSRKEQRIVVLKFNRHDTTPLNAHSHRLTHHILDSQRPGKEIPTDAVSPVPLRSLLTPSKLGALQAD